MLQPIPDRASILKILADCREKEDEGDFLTALKGAHQALADLQKVKTSDLEAMVYARLACALTSSGHYDEARQFAQKTLDLESDTPAAVDALISLGVCAAETNDLCQGEDLLYRAADLSRMIDYPSGLSLALHYLALAVYLLRGQFSMALEMMEQAQAIQREHGSPKWALPFLKAYASQVIGQRKQARDALDDLLPTVKSGTRSAGRYFFLWAMLAMDEGELNKAIEYLGIVLNIASRTGSPMLNMWVRMAHSRYYRLLGEPGIALGWAEEGLHYARRIGSNLFSGQALILMAQAAWDNGDILTTRQCLEEARTALLAHQPSYHLAHILLLRAGWLQHNEKPEASDAWIEAAQAIRSGGYAFLLEQERDLAFPLLAAQMHSRNREARTAAEALLHGLENVPPAPLRVKGLGEFSVWQGRRAIPSQQWQRRRAGELFRFLLVQPGHWAGRDTILDALWPEHLPGQAIDQLHQATSTLRHVLEPDLPDKFPSRYLSVDGERIKLHLPEGSLIDFEEFEYLAPAAMASNRPDKLQNALKLYRDDLFPQDRYNDWSAEHRTHLSELYLRALLILGQYQLRLEHYQEALGCVRQVIRRDPWNEDAVLVGMQACLGQQDAPHAVSLYLKLKETLNSDLGLEPRSDLRELANEIRAQNPLEHPRDRSR